MRILIYFLFRPFPSDDIMFSIKFSSLLTTFARTGRPEFSMGEGESPFEWQRADPNNISHLNIGNHIRMDQGLPNHRFVFKKELVTLLIVRVLIEELNFENYAGEF